MSKFQASLEELAQSLVANIMVAIREVSLSELMASGQTAAGGPPAPSRARRNRAEPLSTLKKASSTPEKAKGKGGRLPRRSAEAIASAVGQVVELLRKNADGLRAEQIREKLGLQAKEMPRILKAGLAAPKVLTSKGRKRATTYFAK